MAGVVVGVEVRGRDRVRVGLRAQPAPLLALKEICRRARAMPTPPLLVCLPLLRGVRLITTQQAAGGGSRRVGGRRLDRLQVTRLLRVRDVEVGYLKASG